jgi:hypothetical protein
VLIHIQPAPNFKNVRITTTTIALMDDSHEQSPCDRLREKLTQSDIVVKNDRQLYIAKDEGDTSSPSWEFPLYKADSS